MARLILALFLFVAQAAVAAPQRVVSLDTCSDNLVLELLPRSRIAALSNEATLPTSLHAEQAKGIRQIRPDIESIVALKPDLVVRSYGGGFPLAGQLKQIGMAVVELDGNETLAAAASNMAAVARATASQLPPAYGKIVTGLPSAPASPRQILYLTPSGFTAGRDTFIDQMIRASGARNMAAEWGISGFAEIDIERLAGIRADHIVLGFADFAKHRQGNWSLYRHPLFARLLKHSRVTAWPSAWLACPGVSSLHAVARLRRDLQ